MKPDLKIKWRNFDQEEIEIIRNAVIKIRRKRRKEGRKLTYKKVTHGQKKIWSSSKEAARMIRHILANDKEVKSIEGMVIPAVGATASVYQIAAEFVRKHIEAAYKKEEKRADATA